MKQYGLLRTGCPTNFISVFLLLLFLFAKTKLQLMVKSFENNLPLSFNWIRSESLNLFKYKQSPE